MIELGGSYGIVSHVVRKHLQSDVLQVVVEANPALIPVCAHNLASAGATEQTRLVNAALGYGPNGRVKFVALPGHHTSYVTEEDVPGALDLPALSLEALAEQYIGEGPFSVVCDIEGAELMLLRNDEAALKRCKALIVELHPEPFEAMGSSLAEVEAMVESLGFEIVERQEQTVAAVKPEGA